jgi:nicotinate-nucleotide adenylyltransferase
VTFFRRAAGRPATLGVLAGTFNPPTRAHLALAAAALGTAEEVVFVLPRVFPHKEYAGASFEDRVRMLELAAAHEPRYSIASTEAGLFIDVARACRRAYGAGVRIVFPCGSDAAARIVNWDYGRAGAIAGQLEEFELLVAERGSRYTPPPELAARIHALEIDPAVRQVSSTEVRERIGRGEPWRHLVPEAIAAVAEKCYGVTRPMNAD